MNAQQILNDPDPVNQINNYMKQQQVATMETIIFNNCRIEIENLRAMLDANANNTKFHSGDRMKS
jgi:hypothetical protein